MVDVNRVRAEMREQIAAFGNLSREQQDALVEAKVNELDGNPRPETRARIYTRNIDSTESQQYFEEAPPPPKPAQRPNSPFKRIGDLPPKPQSQTGVEPQPMRPARFGNPDYKPSKATDIATLPLLTVEEARERLSDVIKDREAIRRQHEFANRRLDDAMDKLDECEYAMVAFKGVNQKILQHDMEAFDAGHDPLKTLPPHLANVRRDRAVAQDRLDRAVALKGRIQAEVAESEQELNNTNQMVEFAVHAVVCAKARSLMADLDDLELAAHELRQRIASLQLPGHNVPDDLVRRAFAPLKQVVGNPDDKATWQSLMASLRDDPDADLD